MPRPRGAKARADQVVALLAEEYPDAHCALNHTSAYELLVATILSAQCTDERVNMVTPAVFARYPTPADLAVADPAEVETLVQSTGFFRSKAKNLIGMAQGVERNDAATTTDDSAARPRNHRDGSEWQRQVDAGPLPGGKARFDVHRG